MYNSVIECGKSIKYVYWVKKDLFGLVWKVWLYGRHCKSNQLIKITMTITTVLHSRAAPSLEYLPYLLVFHYRNLNSTVQFSLIQSHISNSPIDLIDWRWINHVVQGWRGWKQILANCDRHLRNWTKRQRHPTIISLLLFYGQAKVLLRYWSRRCCIVQKGNKTTYREQM